MGSLARGVVGLVIGGVISVEDGRGMHGWGLRVTREMRVRDRENLEVEGIGLGMVDFSRSGRDSREGVKSRFISW